MSDAHEELLLAIQRLGRLMGSRNVSSRFADAAGVEIGQQGVQLLRALLRHGELPVAGLAEAAQMDISAVSRQLRLLEDGGLVRRSASVGDGRVALVKLSPAGRRAAERIREVGLLHLRDSLAGWSTSDTRELARLMTRLVADLQRTELPTGD